MTLRVIDISSWNSVATAADPNAHAVIVKATQALDYVNPSCNAQYATAKKAGKLLGLYHYAGGLDPIKEADYFLKNIENYVGEATLWLDWEAGENRSWGDSNWCRKFVNRVYEKTGIYPGIYIQASSLRQAASCSDVSALWLAGYPTNAASWDIPRFTYSTAPWPTYTIWQFTSGGGLDRNIANLDAAGWKALAKGTKKQESKPKPTTKPSKPATKSYSTAGKSLATIASDVRAGKVGNGDDRKKKLGNLYNSVQAIINGKDVNKLLAEEVKKGRLGNGDARKKLLGNYYNAVQAIINGTTVKTYTVKNGETLSGIAAKLGTTYPKLAAKNGIKAPYTIYPGQKLKY